MADDIKDFGEKIGGARKDRAVSSGPRVPRPRVQDTDPRPAWMRRFVAMEQIDRASKQGMGAQAMKQSAGQEQGTGIGKPPGWSDAARAASADVRSNAKALGPEPQGLQPKAAAMGASHAPAETKPIIHAHKLAKQVAERLAQDHPNLGISANSVHYSTSPAGSSAYIRSRLGDIRISDHGIGARRTHTEGPGYSNRDTAESIVKSILERHEIAAAKYEADRADDARRAAERHAATAPQRAAEAATRAAKEQFFAERGLTDATDTAKKKAWKQHLVEQRASGKIGFQNQSTLNAALAAQGKAEAGKGNLTNLTGDGEKIGKAAKIAQSEPSKPVVPTQSAAAKPATVKDLRAQAKEAGIKGASRMSKSALMEALGKGINKTGAIAMVAAPAVAAAVAYDATRSQASAAGATPAQAMATAGVTAAAAGTMTAGVMYGMGKAMQFGLKGLAKVAPAAAGPVGWAAMAGLTAYGMKKAYDAHKGDGTGKGLAAAALSVVGAEGVLDLGKGTPRNLDAGAVRPTDAQMATFEKADATYKAMQQASTGLVRQFERTRMTPAGEVHEVVRAHHRDAPDYTVSVQKVKG